MSDKQDPKCSPFSRFEEAVSSVKALFEKVDQPTPEEISEAYWHALSSYMAIDPKTLVKGQGLQVLSMWRDVNVLVADCPLLV